MGIHRMIAKINEEKRMPSQIEAISIALGGI